MFLTKASTIARNIWLCINLLFLKSDKSAKYKFPKLVIRVLIYPPLKLWNWLLSLLMNLRFSDPKKWTNKYLFQIIYSVWKYMFSLTSIISIYFFTPSRGYILLTSWFGLSVSENSEYSWKLGYLHRILSITNSKMMVIEEGHDNWLIIVFPPTKTWSKIKIIGPDLRVSTRLP